MVFPTPNGVYVLQYNSQGVGALKVAIRSSTPRFLRKQKTTSRTTRGGFFGGHILRGAATSAAAHKWLYPVDDESSAGISSATVRQSVAQRRSLERFGSRCRNSPADRYPHPHPNPNPNPDPELGNQLAHLTHFPAGDSGRNRSPIECRIENHQSSFINHRCKSESTAGCLSARMCFFCSSVIKILQGQQIRLINRWFLWRSWRDFKIIYLCYYLRSFLFFKNLICINICITLKLIFKVLINCCKLA